jgi:hypothetical protein
MPASYDFGYWPKTTRAVISEFTAELEGGKVAVSWQTISEQDTVAFNVYRLGSDGKRRIKVNAEPLPGLLVAPQGGTYRLIDASAPTGIKLTYYLEELDTMGHLELHGPYVVQTKFVRPRMSFLSLTASGGSKSEASSPEYTTKAHAAVTATKPVVAATKSVPGGLLKNAGQPKSKGVSSGFPLRIGTKYAGIHKITVAEIASAAGADEAQVSEMLRHGALALSSRGKAVACWLEDGDLCFYAENHESIYSNENVYWLRPGIALMARQVVAEGTPVGAGSFSATVHAEENHWAPTASYRSSGDIWVWNYLVGGNAAVGKRSYKINVPEPAESGACSLRIKLVGGNATSAELDHHIEVKLNGHLLGSDEWDGLGRHVAEFACQPDWLTNGENNVEITALKNAGVAFSVVYVDSLALSYQRNCVAAGGEIAGSAEGRRQLTLSGFGPGTVRVLDLAIPSQPVILKGHLRSAAVPQSIDLHVADKLGEFYACDSSAIKAPQRIKSVATDGQLHNETTEADMVIITPTSLRSGAERLADYRRGLGWNVVVATLEDIENEFNYGLHDPRATRRFLGYALRHWKQAPRYVLLAGGGTYDYKNFLGLNDNLLPPLMVVTHFGMQASDEALADVTGDGLPDFAIGRIPALSVAQLDAALAKIKAYEAGGSWRSKALFCADNADAGGLFGDDALRLSQIVSSSYDVELTGIASDSAAVVRSAVLDRLSSGAGLFCYIGHAGVTALAKEEVLKSGDVAGLNNAGHAGVMLMSACDAAQFAIPGYHSLGQELVTGETGAAAVWSAGGQAYNEQSVRLAEGMLKQFSAGATPSRLGDAVADSFAKQADGRNLTRRYNLLGDPALAVKSKSAPPRECMVPADISEKELQQLKYAPCLLTSSGTVAVCDSREVFADNPFGAVSRLPDPNPGVLAFGDVPVGILKVLRIRIHNNGNSDLTVTGLILPAGYKGSWSGAIAAGGSSPEIPITFKPTEEKAYSGEGVIVCDSVGIGADCSLSFSGKGSPAVSSILNDFDSDRISDIVVYRLYNQHWIGLRSSDGTMFNRKWGVAGDVPMPADYDGDGQTDMAVFRPSTGWWFGRLSSDGILRHKWGVPGDVAVPADYDGDGKADLAVYRPSTQKWVALNSLDGSVLKRKWGIAGDVPVPADYDGDGKTDFAIYRPSNNKWVVLKSSDGKRLHQKWGETGDAPVNNLFWTRESLK